MAVVFLDGVGHYDTPLIGEKYSTINTGLGPSTAWAVTAEGRFGNCIKRTALTNGTPGYLDAAPLLTQSGVALPTASGFVGFAMKVDDLLGVSTALPSSCRVCRVMEGTLYHLSFDLQSDGTFAVHRYDSATQVVKLAVSAEGLTADTWAYVECKWVISDTVGVAQIRVNGTTILSFAGDTKGTWFPIGTLGVWTAARLWEMQSAASPLLIVRTCDLYLANMTGSDNIDFLGDIVVDKILPDGVGNSSSWTPTPGPNNWADVNEVPPDGDTSYVAATAPGTRDTYSFEDVLGDPLAIQIVAYARKETAGGAEITPTVRTAGVDYDGIAQGVADTAYTFYHWPYDTNPDTGAPWTKAEMDAAEFGPLKSL